jgi:hypothetical protein
VHSNGIYQGTGDSCAGWSTANPAAQDGYGWQCVELAARLYAVKGWGGVRADGGPTAGTYRYGAKYIPEGSPGLQFHSNGSGYIPVSGDLIVEWSATWGHVSVVDHTVGGSIYAVEQNASLTGRHTYGLSGSTLTGQYGSSVRGVMHAPANPNTSAGGGSVADGSFVQIAGHPEIYRIAGGAPTYVSTWSAFGGSQPTVTLSQASFDALRPVPADGTFIVGAQRGEVYRIAGGAPLYVSTWDAFGGAQPTLIIDQAAIDSAGSGGAFNHLNYRPVDGTFIVGAQRGEVYRIVGGAPTYVSTWSAFGGPQPTVTVDQSAIDAAGGGAIWNHLLYRPADGTFVVGAQRGEVYRFAGGAPIYVSTWDAFGGAQPVTTIDQAAIDSGGSGGLWNHVNYFPMDGTFVVGAQRGEVYRFAGGAPIYVSTWDAFGGAQPATAVDQFSLDNAGAASGAYSHARLRPTDGTFLSGLPSQGVFRVAGGIATYVPSWAPYGGAQPTVSINDSALDYAGAAAIRWQHLRSATPTSTLNMVAGATTQPSVTLSWRKPWTSSALSSFDLRRQSATPTTGFSAWVLPAGWAGLTGTAIASQTLTAGSTYCYSVRAHNLAAQTGPWSASRCVTKPTDDRVMTASAGWSRPALDSRFYSSTYSNSTTIGATLTLANVQASRLTLLATRCAACGSVGIYVGTARIGTVNLAAATTQRTALIPLAPFSYRIGKVTLRVLSSGKLVQIDGIAISRV